MRKSVRIIQGDCLEAMAGLPDNSVDSIVTDPPYGLEFMGKEWDSFSDAPRKVPGTGGSQAPFAVHSGRISGANGFRRSLNPADAGRDDVFGRASKTGPEYRTGKPASARIRKPSQRDEQPGAAHNATTFLAARNMPESYVAGNVYQEWCESWARECLRILKPGGYLVAFGGTRTYHRLTCAIEDAGFEIRDSLHWLYGTGFPKSLDVSKAIDKAARGFPQGGTDPTSPNHGNYAGAHAGAGGSAFLHDHRKYVKAGGKGISWFGPWLREERARRGITAHELCERGGFYKNVNHGGLVVNWELGLGIPTARQFNKVCEILDLPFKRIEEVEREVIGIKKAVPGVAFTSEGPTELEVTAPASDEAKEWDGWGTALKPAHEPIVLARKPLTWSN